VDAQSPEMPASVPATVGVPVAVPPFDPLIVGLEADAMQAAGHPLGFANLALYLLAKAPAITDVRASTPGDDYLTTLGED
jgi:hypothetical protein